MAEQIEAKLRVKRNLKYFYADLQVKNALELRFNFSSSRD